MDSAERSKRVCLAIIPSGLIEGLKHSVSRMDLLEEAETSPVHRSRSMEQLLEATNPLPNGKLGSTVQPSNFAQGQRSDHATKTRGSARLSRSSLHDHPLYAPSIGSRRESNQSLVSSTVETAAHIARSSMRSFSSHRGGAFKVCTSVGHLHLTYRSVCLFFCIFFFTRIKSLIFTNHPNCLKLHEVISGSSPEAVIKVFSCFSTFAFKKI